MKKFIINWLNRCPKCGAKDADVSTEKGSRTRLWVYDKVTCRKCGLNGEIDVIEDSAFCVWDEIEELTK